MYYARIAMLGDETGRATGPIWALDMERGKGGHVGMPASANWQIMAPLAINSLLGLMGDARRVQVAARG